MKLQEMGCLGANSPHWGLRMACALRAVRELLGHPITSGITQLLGSPHFGDHPILGITPFLGSPQHLWEEKKNPKTETAPCEGLKWPFFGPKSQPGDGGDRAPFCSPFPWWSQGKYLGEGLRLMGSARLDSRCTGEKSALLSFFLSFPFFFCLLLKNALFIGN